MLLTAVSHCAVTNHTPASQHPAPLFTQCFTCIGSAGFGPLAWRAAALASCLATSRTEAFDPLDPHFSRLERCAAARYKIARNGLGGRFDPLLSHGTFVTHSHTAADGRLTDQTEKC